MICYRGFEYRRIMIFSQVIVSQEISSKPISVSRACQRTTDGFKNVQQPSHHHWWREGFLALKINAYLAKTEPCSDFSPQLTCPFSKPLSVNVKALNVTEKVTKQPESMEKMALLLHVGILFIFILTHYWTIIILMPTFWSTKAKLRIRFRNQI